MYWPLFWHLPRRNQRLCMTVHGLYSKEVRILLHDQTSPAAHGHPIQKMLMLHHFGLLQATISPQLPKVRHAMPDYPYYHLGKLRHGGGWFAEIRPDLTVEPRPGLGASMLYTHKQWGILHATISIPRPILPPVCLGNLGRDFIFFTELRKTSWAANIGKNVFLTFSRYLLGGPWQGRVITGLGTHLN